MEHAAILCPGSVMVNRDASILDCANRILASAIERAEEAGARRSIPAHVRAAWGHVREHITHDGVMDGHRFDLEDFFDERK